LMSFRDHTGPKILKNNEFTVLGEYTPEFPQTIFAFVAFEIHQKNYNSNGFNSSLPFFFLDNHFLFHGPFQLALSNLSSLWVCSDSQCPSRYFFVTFLFFLFFSSSFLKTQDPAFIFFLIIAFSPPPLFHLFRLCFLYSVPSSFSKLFCKCLLHLFVGFQNINTANR